MAGRHEELIRYVEPQEIQVSRNLTWNDDDRARREYEGEYTAEELRKREAYKEKERLKRQKTPSSS